MQKVGVGDELVRHKFIQALPSSVAPVVAAQKDLSLDQLSRLADELLPFVSANCLITHSASNNSNKHQVSRSRSPSSIPIGIKPFHRDQK